MLVLTRKQGETIVIEGGTIVIEGGIRVTITDIRRGIVRVGIEAPEGVKVHREEVFERITAAKDQG